VYESLGPDAGKNYSFVSCFSPASSDPKASAAMSAAADQYGQGKLKDDVNFVAGWVIGNMVADAIAKAGAEPTREKLSQMVNAGFTANTGGLSSELKYTPTDHLGLVGLKPLSYDYGTKSFRSYGDYADFTKYLN
jgi:hypothetical protein